MGWSGLGQYLVPMCCEYGNKASNSIKGDLLESYSKESALWNQYSKIRYLSYN
jgi:hypothetical protein